MPKRKANNVIDAMLDLSVADDLRTEWAGPVSNANIEGYKELMGSPYTLPGVSDGGAHVKFITPAIYPTEVPVLAGAREQGVNEPGRSSLPPEWDHGLGRGYQGPWGRYVQVWRPTSWSTMPDTVKALPGRDRPRPAGQRVAAGPESRRVISTFW